MQYNVNNTSIKRILREVKEMEAEPSNQYTASPLEDNLFEWHFTIRGPSSTEFEGGLYHGRIILPPEYPFKPPNIVLLNPSGRFEVGTKICLSISSYHPEHWQPSWSIRTVLVALISFMPTKGEGAIGALDYPPEERRKLALKTVDFVCDKCGAKMRGVLPPLEEPKTHTPAEEDSAHTHAHTPAPPSTQTPAEDAVQANAVHFNNPPPPPTYNYNNNNNEDINDAQMVENDVPAYIHAPAGQALVHDQVAAMMHAPAAIPAPAAAHAHGVPVPVDGVSANASDSQILDLIILAILVAIVALIARKVYNFVEL